MRIAESSSQFLCTGFHDPDQLFVDGGLIQSNPSLIGGTWAYRLIHNGEAVRENAGVITLKDSEMPRVSNNLSEMLALLKGLNILPFDWRGTVFSDSKITLGRAFANWHWSKTELPDWMLNQLLNQKARLVHWNQIHCALLDGHPTKAQLQSGFGKRGHRVHEHQKWCDEACTKQANKYKRWLDSLSDQDFTGSSEYERMVMGKWENE